MRLSGVHLLLTYQCTYECDHCFVWGSPEQSGTLTLRQTREILRQARDLGSVEWIYFEGGEPCLYYPILLEGVRSASGMGFRVGLVSNGYWATEREDAIEWLAPFAGLIEDLSISSDLYHGDEPVSREARRAVAAAETLGIPCGLISIAQPRATEATASVGQLPPGESSVRYRGRAAVKLASKGRAIPWERFDACPYEDLRGPDRVHVDPLGHVHLCQGISLGNLFEVPLAQLCETYDPESHPIAGPLLRGGPAELVRQYGLAHDERYADACHLCYEARSALRQRFPEVLCPDQMYGVTSQ